MGWTPSWRNAGQTGGVRVQVAGPEFVPPEVVRGELFVVADDNFFSVDVASSRTRKRRKVNFEKISSGLVNLEISGTVSLNRQQQQQKTVRGKKF